MEVSEGSLQTNSFLLSHIPGGRHPLAHIFGLIWPMVHVHSYIQLASGFISGLALAPLYWVLPGGGPAFPVLGAATCIGEVLLTSCCPHLSFGGFGHLHVSVMFSTPTRWGLLTSHFDGLCGTSRMDEGFCFAYPLLTAGVLYAGPPPSVHDAGGGVSGSALVISRRYARLQFTFVLWWSTVMVTDQGLHYSCSGSFNAFR